MSPQLPAVYRAPLRSRRDDVDRWAAVERGLARGLCGFGGAVHPPPQSLDEAVELAAAQHDPRTANRISRFGQVDTGSYAWTRDGDGQYWLGRIEGPYSYDADDAAAAVDLVHVRQCRWSGAPLQEQHVPPAVVATFGRGGRNFQQVHHPYVGEQSARLWRSLR